MEPLLLKKGFLSGYIADEGCVRHGTYSFGPVSPARTASPWCNIGKKAWQHSVDLARRTGCLDLRMQSFWERVYRKPLIRSTTSLCRAHALAQAFVRRRFTTLTG